MDVLESYAVTVGPFRWRIWAATPAGAAFVGVWLCDALGFGDLGAAFSVDVARRPGGVLRLPQDADPPAPWMEQPVGHPNATSELVAAALAACGEHPRRVRIVSPLRGPGLQG
jgi:hypothetical protein